MQLGKFRFGPLFGKAGKFAADLKKDAALAEHDFVGLRLDDINLGLGGKDFGFGALEE